MNPTQIFEFVMNWINQKIIKFNRVPLGRNRSAHMHSAWHDPRPCGARPACAVLARPACAAHGHAGRGPAWPRPSRRAAHDGATRGGAARRPGDDMELVHGKRLRSSGSPARDGGRRCDVDERAPVGTAAGSARPSGCGRRGRGEAVRTREARARRGSQDAGEATVGATAAHAR
jgi:hypothetical protein